MASQRNLPTYEFTTPRNGFFRWLTDPGDHVPPEMRRNMLGELLHSPIAMLLGLFSAVLVSGYAVVVLHELVFVVFIVLDLVGSMFICHAAFAASQDRPVPTDLFLWVASCWCAQQGCMAFVAMRSGVPSLQLLAATLVLGLAGPACTRQYAAPRWALFLIGLIELPLVAGAGLSGTVWGSILVIQAPGYLLVSFLLIRRSQAIAVAHLIARHESLHHATHDAVTGILNRAGFRRAMAAADHPRMTRHVMFYLDLDGFRTVNDRLGYTAGDRLLSEVAARVKAFLAPGDLIARLGSDEFLLVAQDMTSAEAPDFAHALIRSISDTSYDLGGSIPVAISVSIGFACCPEDADNPDILQSMADTALYEAQAAGAGIAHRFQSRRQGVTADKPPASSTPASNEWRRGSSPP